MNLHIRRSAIFCAVGALSLCACGDDSKPTPMNDVTADTSAPVDTMEEDTAVVPGGCLATAPADVAGVWAMQEQQTALVSNVPGIGTMNQVSTSLYLATISDNEGGVPTLDVVLCDWETADDSGLGTLTGMSQTLLDSLDGFDRDVTIATANGEARFTTTQGITLRGITMDNEDTDAFPTEVTDERIFDQDADAKAGITLVISGLFQGELFVVHRHRATLDGCFESNNTIAGLTTWTTEQLIIGSNPTALAQVQPVAQTHPDAPLSKFKMVRATGVANCSDLKSRRSEFFPVASE